MTNIAHQKFLALMQVAADAPLRPEEQMALESHLAECNDCRSRAQSLDELQDGLRRVMQQQWNVRSKPLSAAAIKARSRRTIAQNHVASMFGKFAFIPMLALTIFMVLTAKMSNPQKASLTVSGTPSMAMLIPRPPSLTVAKAHTQTCRQISYSAQENETISGIAIKYNVTRESIASYNRISSDRLDAPRLLIIPICERTPLENTTTPTASNTVTIPSDYPAPRG